MSVADLRPYTWRPDSDPPDWESPILTPCRSGIWWFCQCLFDNACTPGRIHRNIWVASFNLLLHHLPHGSVSFQPPSSPFATWQCAVLTTDACLALINSSNTFCSRYETAAVCARLLQIAWLIHWMSHACLLVCSAHGARKEWLAG